MTAVIPGVLLALAVGGTVAWLLWPVHASDVYPCACDDCWAAHEVQGDDVTFEIVDEVYAHWNAVPDTAFDPDDDGDPELMGEPDDDTPSADPLDYYDPDEGDHPPYRAGRAPGY